jgi:hypothetical protein
VLRLRNQRPAPQVGLPMNEKHEDNLDRVWDIIEKVGRHHADDAVSGPGTLPHSKTHYRPTCGTYGGRQAHPPIRRAAARTGREFSWQLSCRYGNGQAA